MAGKIQHYPFTKHYPDIQKSILSFLDECDLHMVSLCAKNIQILANTTFLWAPFLRARCMPILKVDADNKRQFSLYVRNGTMMLRPAIPDAFRSAQGIARQNRLDGHDRVLDVYEIFSALISGDNRIDINRTALTESLQRPLYGRRFAYDRRSCVRLFLELGVDPTGGPRKGPNEYASLENTLSEGDMWSNGPVPRTDLIKILLASKRPPNAEVEKRLSARLPLTLETAARYGTVEQFKLIWERHPVPAQGTNCEHPGILGYALTNPNLSRDPATIKLLLDAKAAISDEFPGCTEAAISDERFGLRCGRYRGMLDAAIFNPTGICLEILDLLYAGGARPTMTRRGNDGIGMLLGSLDLALVHEPPAPEAVIHWLLDIGARPSQKDAYDSLSWGLHPNGFARHGTLHLARVASAVAKYSPALLEKLEKAYRRQFSDDRKQAEPAQQPAEAAAAAAPVPVVKPIPVALALDPPPPEEPDLALQQPQPLPSPVAAPHPLQQAQEPPHAAAPPQASESSLLQRVLPRPLYWLISSIARLLLELIGRLRSLRD